MRTEATRANRNQSETTAYSKPNDPCEPKPKSNGQKGTWRILVCWGKSIEEALRLVAADLRDVATVEEQRWRNKGGGTTEEE